MDDIDHPELIEEWKQNVDAIAYENNINQDVRIPSIKKTFDRNNNLEYWPTSIKEILKWLPSFDIMEFTAERIKNDKNFYRCC